MKEDKNVNESCQSYSNIDQHFSTMQRANESNRSSLERPMLLARKQVDGGPSHSGTPVPFRLRRPSKFISDAGNRLKIKSNFRNDQASLNKYHNGKSQDRMSTIQCKDKNDIVASNLEAGDSNYYFAKECLAASTNNLSNKS